MDPRAGAGATGKDSGELASSLISAAVSLGMPSPLTLFLFVALLLLLLLEPAAGACASRCSICEEAAGVVPALVFQPFSSSSGVVSEMEEGFEVGWRPGLLLNEPSSEDGSSSEGIVDRVALVSTVCRQGFVGVVGVRIGEGKGGGSPGSADGAISVRMAAF